MSFKVQAQDVEVLPATAGSIIAVNCNATPLVVDICSFPKCKASAPATADADQSNPAGKFVRIHAEAGDLYYATGAAVNAVNTISPTARTTVNATTGAVTVNGNECEFLPQGSYVDVLVMPGPAPKTVTPYGAASPVRYIGLVTATGNAVCRLFQSSP